MGWEIVFRSLSWCPFLYFVLIGRSALCCHLHCASAQPSLACRPATVPCDYYCVLHLCLALFDADAHVGSDLPLDATFPLLFSLPVSICGHMIRGLGRWFSFRSACFDLIRGTDIVTTLLVRKRRSRPWAMMVSGAGWRWRWVSVRILGLLRSARRGGRGECLSLLEEREREEVGELEYAFGMCGCTGRG